MSKQASLSATISAITMALFAASALLGGLQGDLPRSELPEMSISASVELP
ncbi:hypothetical protein GRI43_00715 [Altererythrobacter luteolus]|uniref:Uncharacterized protein n=1 Tax=Pontixanthobacter luteolus TaxID=295089 RepID=A0A6I4V0I7_9SPHN|nr:hypothetical protein [Pontixanthobacter luteolus]MXP45914.1 hypothetical protein [Pontixanthobacter luteolus]